MERHVSKDIEHLLDGAYGAIKGKRFNYLHGLSNHVIHSLTIYRQKEILNVAIIVYSLSKIFEKERYTKQKNILQFTKKTIELLDKARTNLKKQNIAYFKDAINSLIKLIRSFTKKAEIYTHDLLDIAKIDKASHLYRHGMSLGEAAETTGTSKWELMPEIAQTKIHEQIDKINIKDRLNLIKELFK